ncbi:MAG: aldo/keto reductase, partial [Phycisphaerae bacterium]
PLGSTGFEVSEIGFGAWAIGGLGYGSVPQEDGIGAVAAYVEAGGRNIDTARGYGISEILVGKGLKRVRAGDEVFIASKSGNQHPPAIETDLETSIFCVGREVMDLYYIHVPPADEQKLGRMLDKYQQLKDAGRTRLIGVSATGTPGEGTVDLVRRMIADGRVDAMMLGYSIAQPLHEEVIAEAKQAGMGIVARTAMGGGLLTGRYKPGDVFDNPANDGRSNRPQENLDALLTRVQELGGQFVRPPYETMGQVALAWVLADPNISCVVVGGKNARQVQENIAVAGLPPMDPGMREEISRAAADLNALYDWKK